LLSLAERWQRRRWSRAQLLGRFADDHVFDVPSTAAQHFVERGSSIRAQVEPVSHLDRVGRPLSTAFGVRPSSITDDDLHAWVMTQPVGEDVGGAIVEQIDRTVRLEIDQQRAITALLPAQGNVVNTQYPRTTLLVAIRERMKEPQERVWTDWHASLARQPSATLAAGLQREGRQQIGGALGSARIAS
jgi:hypothetical protein